MEGYSAYVIPSEDVLLGTSSGRYLSPVRRFFCLLVTFDLMFTILLWVLSIILAKGATSISDAFETEVFQYSFFTKLFDVVMCAAIRFVVLLLFYGLIQCQHWIPVALTTTLTCSFLLVKVFLFKWDVLKNATYPVMLVLSSFILSWSEAWFFDFRLIPQEFQAALFHARQGGGVGESQRVISWLGRSVSQIAQNAPIQRSGPASTADFFSLPESPMPSDGEDSETESMEKRARRLYRGNFHTSVPDIPECKVWLQQAPGMAEKLLTRVRQSSWVLDKTADSGDNVFVVKGPRKLFMISGSIGSPPSKVAFELFQNFELMPHWNPAVIHCEILQRLSPTTDVTYQVSKEGAGGAVSPRDFVTLRHHQTCPDGTHILASESVKHPARPKQQKITRAFNGCMGFILTPSEGNPSRTTFQWVLDVDLQIQGWIPKAVIDKAFIAASIETIICLRGKMARTVDRIDIEVDGGPELNVGTSSDCTTGPS